MPYGYENDKTTPITTTQSKNIVFGFIGRLDIYTKGLDTLVKAFAKFQKNQPEAQLWIIGDSKEKLILEKMIKAKSLEKNIILYGSKFGKEKDELLQKNGCFCSSIQERRLTLICNRSGQFW